MWTVYKETCIAPLNEPKQHFRELLSSSLPNKHHIYFWPLILNTINIQNALVSEDFCGTNHWHQANLTTIYEASTLIVIVFSVLRICSFLQIQTVPWWFHCNKLWINGRSLKCHDSVLTQPPKRQHTGIQACCPHGPPGARPDSDCVTGDRSRRKSSTSGVHNLLDS